MHALPLSDLYRGLVVHSGSAHSFFDLSGHCEEGLFNVGGVFGGGFKEGDPKAVGEFLHSESISVIILCLRRDPKKDGLMAYLCNSVLDDFLIRHIALVAYEQLVDTFSRVAVDLLEPLLDVVE